MKLHEYARLGDPFEWRGGLLPETARVLKFLLGQEKSLSEGTECYHNILIQRNCDNQDTQWNPFHTQAAEEIICPILNSGIRTMELIQIKEIFSYF